MSADASSRARVVARVAVVGGGLAGLAAAFRLSAHGADVVVFERETAPGGRAAGRSEDGFSIERSLPLLSNADRGVLDWIHELGESDTLLPLRLVQLAQAHRGQIRPIDPTSRGGVARIPGVRRIDGLRVHRLPRLMRRYAASLDPARPERAARWDDRSVSDFARLYFGRTSCGYWIAPDLMSSYLSDADQTSRVAFLLEWAGGRGGRARLGVPRAPLQELVRAAGERLALHTSCEVQRIEGGSPGLMLACVEAGGRERRLEVDAVVLATAAGESLRLARSLLAPAERDYLRDVSYAPAVTLTVALERPLTGLPQHVRVPRREGSAIETFLADPGQAGGRAPQGCGVVTAAASERFGLEHAGAPDEVVEKALFEALVAIQPRIGRLARFTRLLRRNQSVPHFQVGAYRQLARFQRVLRDRRSAGRRLYFAGDYLVGPRVEHAVSSGARAAQALVTDLT